MNAADSSLPIRLLRAFTSPKRSDEPNEDRWLASEDGTTFAISDGASVSFDSASWAAILVRRFVGNPVVDQEWLYAAIAEYEQAHDRIAMDWMQQAAFDRGSSATLLGAVYSGSGPTVRVIVIGDSLLAMTDGERLIQTIPYTTPEEFAQSPNLLSTNSFENGFLDEERIAGAWHDLPIASDSRPTLLLMTDAIGRWLLDSPDPDRVTRLLLISNDQEFDNFVERERSEGRLRKDDSTLMVLG